MKTYWGHGLARGAGWLGEQMVLAVVLVFGMIEYVVVPARPHHGHHSKS